MRSAFHRTTIHGEVDDSAPPPPQFAREGSRKADRESLVFAAVGQTSIGRPPRAEGQKTLVAQLASEGTVEESGSETLPETVPADRASGSLQTPWASMGAHDGRQFLSGTLLEIK